MNFLSPFKFSTAIFHLIRGLSIAIQTKSWILVIGRIFGLLKMYTHVAKFVE